MTKYTLVVIYSDGDAFVYYVEEWQSVVTSLLEPDDDYNHLVRHVYVRENDGYETVARKVYGLD